MSLEEQAKYSCILGKHYPLPIVDNHETTKVARDKIWKVKKSNQAQELSKLIVQKHASLSSRR